MTRWWLLCSLRRVRPLDKGHVAEVHEFFRRWGVEGTRIRLATAEELKDEGYRIDRTYEP